MAKKEWTQERKDRHSAAMKAAWARTEVREKMSNAIRDALSNPDVRAKMKASHAKRKAVPEGFHLPQVEVSELSVPTEPSEEVLPPEIGA